MNPNILQKKNRKNNNQQILRKRCYRGGGTDGTELKEQVQVQNNEDRFGSEKTKKIYTEEKVFLHGRS